jgi:hypothetical protein
MHPQSRKIAATLLLTTLSTATAPAATPPTPPVDTWSIGITAGTLGLGPELAYRYGHYIGVRASAGFLSYNHDETVSDITYNGRLKLDSYGLAADLFPFGGGFRISAGARKNDNRIDLNGTPSTAVTLGNTVYTPAQVGTLSGTVEGNSFAPTLSLGYGGRLAKGFTLGAEIGVMFQGTPKVNNYHATGLLASTPGFQADLAEERQKVDDKVHNYQYWPIAQIILLYRF